MSKLVLVAAAAAMIAAGGGCGSGGHADAAVTAADGPAGGGDAPARADAAGSSGDGGAFACAAATCDPASQYCYEIAAGVVKPPRADAAASGVDAAAPPPDAAPAQVGCNSLPAACATTPTCACVKANVTVPFSACASQTIFCTDTGGRITLMCELP